MNFNWEEFKTENIAVHCDTKEKALNFLNECKKRGCNNIVEQDMDVKNGYICSDKNNFNIIYNDIDFYKKINFKIIEWEMTDMVNHPTHYTQSKFECIEIIEEITKPCNKFEAYLVGTILKYLWRFKYKNGLEDLKKARWYLDKLISNEGE